MREEEFLRLSSWLSSKHFPLKYEWLRICIEYLNHSLGENTYSSEQLAHLVVQQFLQSKLSETLNPVMKIPVNAVKVIIVKKMIFEVTSYVNISSSLYEQLSECTRHNDDLSWFHGGSKVEHDEENREQDTLFQFSDKDSNSRPVFKKHGMMKLSLTDGINTLKAMDTEEVFDEKDLVPGVKLLLVSRVKCRRGVLLLNKSNCLLLGGQIDSLHYDRVKQLSAALNIDLDAEKKRRQESLEKAAASVTRNHKKQLEKKKNASLNQSSLSPFLVRTDRKTGTVTNPPRVPPVQLEPEKPLTSSRPLDSETAEVSDISIEEVLVDHEPIPGKATNKLNQRKEQQAQHVPSTSSTFNLPPSLPTERLSSLEINRKEKPETCVEKPLKLSTLEKLSRNTERKKSTPEEWSFNSSSTFGNSFKTRHVHDFDSKATTTLPVKTVNEFSTSKKRIQSDPSKPTLGDSIMSGEKRKDITEWPWDERKGSEEEEETSAARKRDDSVMQIPKCFMKESSTPRSMKKITEAIPEPSSNDNPDPLLNETIEYEEQEQEDEIVPATPFPPPIERFEYFDREVEDKDDSITECTIDQEGRLECERWGLGERKRRIEVADEEYKYNNYNSLKVRAIDNDYDIIMKNMGNQKQIHDQLSMQDFNGNEYAGPISSSTFIPSSHTQIQTNQPITQPTQNWNFSDLQKNAMNPPLTVKTERIEQCEERRLLPVLKTPNKNSSQDIAVMKNKQSANVQIYKTPFAKRLNSSDSTSDTTSLLFQRMANLQIVPLADALVNRKFWMMSKIVVVMPTICTQLHELKSDGIDWLLQISVTDTSAGNVTCRVATDLLNRIFGFTVQQCKNLFNLNQVEELRMKKIEAEKKLVGFKRLDLLIWIEVSPDSDKLPLIVDVKTISDALNIL
uniref:DUF1767 domain-containing protein n=1 Tax=Caenorhabditis tropicalis TaxID=1561998 RepID=A0A1I7THN9_9PELO